MKQIIYSKFSNERNYRFAIRTDICEDENGQRSVRKVCSCPEGQLHMTELYRWYQIFLRPARVLGLAITGVRSFPEAWS